MQPKILAVRLRYGAILGNLAKARGHRLTFPTFDLGLFESATGEERQERARDLDEICREIGFLVLTGHDVPVGVIEEQWRVVRDFFGQDLGEKSKVAAPYPGYPYGWLPEQSEALAASKGVKTPPDLKESFNGGPLEVVEGIKDAAAYEFCYQPTLWPEIDGFQTAWCAYYNQMEALACRIMAAFAEALGLPPGHFGPYISNPISALRALRYPPTGPVAQDGQERAGAHTDYGSLTILMPFKARPGLQVMQGENWVDVPVPEGAFVINIGDLMAHWTNNRWVSTLHRVIARPNQAERFSLAYFHQPNWDAEIFPLDGSGGASVVSGRYLMNKFKSTSA